MRNKFEIMHYRITIRSKWSSIWLPSRSPGKTAPLADCETRHRQKERKRKIECSYVQTAAEDNFADGCGQYSLKN